MPRLRVGEIFENDFVLRWITALTLLVFFVIYELRAESSELYVVGQSEFRPFIMTTSKHVQHGDFRPVMPMTSAKVTSNSALAKFRPLSPKTTPVIIKRAETIELKVPSYPVPSPYWSPSPFR